jgi:Zn-dependent protease
MLGGSIRLFRVQGIQISVHATFFLLLAYVAWEGWKEAGLAGAGTTAAGLVAFFACVLMHELGHSFAARAFGVFVPRITLLPIGGVAEFSSIPRAPLQEIVIALAGPAVNFLLIGALALFTQIPTWSQVQVLDLTPLQVLVVMNAMMGVFNLLPAFPMDGGRVVRALLARRMRYVDATRYAATAGKILSLGGIVLMLYQFQHIVGAIMFLFIMIAGELEYRAVLRQDSDERRWREFLRRIYGEAPEYPRAP